MVWWLTKDLWDTYLEAKEMQRHPESYSGVQAWETLCVPFFQRHWVFLTFFAVLYVPATFALKRFMKNRKALELKWPLRLWNLWLFVFSAWGSYYMVPPVLGEFFRGRPIFSLVCDQWCYALDPMVGVAAAYFNFFKFMEFTDTAFILLRKRKLIFLHWYHHILTMVMAWYGNQYNYLYGCSGVFFVPMNFLVHTVMYFYYLLCAFGYRPKWDLYVTLFQTIQMAIGCYILAVSATCPKQNWTMNFLMIVMYGSYLYLFTKIVLERYVFARRVTTKAPPKKGDVVATEKQSKTD